MWPLEDLQDVLKKVDGSLDPLDAWQVLDKTNPLVTLAIYVFNFIPNSASCERLFSEMGNVKTKKRNRLSVKKTRDCAFLKGELRRQRAEEGTACQRLKRQFGNKPVGELDIDPTGSHLEEEEYLKQLNITESEYSDGNESDSYVIDPVLQQKTQSRVQLVAKELIQAVDDDSDMSGLDTDMDSEPAGSSSIPRLVPKIRLFFGQKSLIPIKDIFNWSVEAGWDEFWGTGVRHHREDTSCFYELLSRASSENYESGNEGSGTTRTRQEPISL
ncbi:hypothetical protein APHAL10511_004026 [Amanita phalloides]|nr:hypothetical protein APHAL10511_004026 [Amanita phalloides]